MFNLLNLFYRRIDGKTLKIVIAFFQRRGYKLSVVFCRFALNATAQSFTNHHTAR